MLDASTQADADVFARSKLHVGLTKICHTRRYIFGVLGWNEAADWALVFDFNGGSGGTRTLDQRIKSPLL